jgi:hypothetical protein
LREQIELAPILDHLTARPIVGGLSVALARAFKIIDPDLKNPQARHWQRSF